MAYLDFRRELVAGEVAEFTCLVGTMAQETFLTNPAIRDACFESISGHAETLEADLAEAIEAPGLATAMDAKSLALHTQAVLQGAFRSEDRRVGTQCVRTCSFRWTAYHS